MDEYSELNSTDVAGNETLRCIMNNEHVPVEELLKKCQVPAIVQELTLKNEDSLKTYQILILILYITLIVIGILGNLVIIGTIMSLKRKQRNYFILNLAISDLLLCLITQPSNIIWLHMKYFKWNIHLCRFITFFQCANIFVSSFSISAISLDRFFIIVYMKKRENTQNMASWITLSIWILSFILASPLVLLVTAQTKDNQVVCSEKSIKSKIIFSVFAYILQFSLPIGIVILANTCIALKINERNQRVEVLTKRKTHQQVLVSISDVGYNEKEPSKMKFSKTRKSNPRRANFILILIVVVFAISWMPLSVDNILLDILTYSDNNITEESQLQLLGRIKDLQGACLLITLLSTCLNPILYGWLNDDFKVGLKNFFTLQWKKLSNN